MKEEGREDYGPSRKHKEEVGVGDNTRGADEGGGERRKCGGNKQGLNNKDIDTQKQETGQLLFTHVCL